MKPNLFTYATSELSQDAILAWMLAWADSKCRATDAATHELGLDFLRLIYEKHDRPLPSGGHSVRVETQHKRIDVSAVVDDSMGILIEDKTGTEEHSNQLARYREQMKNDFSDEQILCIYVQTYEQGSYENVEAKEYEIIGRADLLALLDRYTKGGGTNEIALDFGRHMADLDQKFKAYDAGSLEGWDSYAWQGFFVELKERTKERLGKSSWGYVANAAGGFQAFWWGFSRKSEGYLQLEEEDLCFKISVPGDSRLRRQERNDWHRRVINAASHLGLAARKPDRFGNGETMTVAVMDRSYRAMNKDGGLDWSGTIETLELAHEVLRLAAESGSGSRGR